ncbi:SGNH/GDSL hydrolase family protein [Alicyclobacillus dauci]|uniref:SGNH/GDSL hydrolase family protein n=1 Tax=Alicyclobacillus dauci TaxID=1475485 RepID=A0ABY6YYI3_9BACL|nr:SGNH/GDSL hydrolase family protein [Alicyclobacillus dauci]WAH35181.1 SGNH/GDSL hydrolase family protein [Alicyclobacillus dauci]
MKKFVWMTLICCLCMGVGALLGYHSVLSAQSSSNVSGSPEVTVKTKTPVRVMAIGGSAAYGEKDTVGNGGYLGRAMSTLSKKSRVQYDFTNESRIGQGPHYYVNRMTALLRQDKPSLVVISFGLLDDLYAKTRQSKINQDIIQEIMDALKVHAKVVVITPPVTGASYVEFADTEGPAVQSMVNAIRNLHESNVHVVDLFSQTKSYLASHHQTWKTYAADGWHPNPSGYALYASLLANDLQKATWLPK